MAFAPLNEWLKEMHEKYAEGKGGIIDLREVDEPVFRDFKGVWIPKEIWLDKDLTWIEKLMLTEIDSLSTKDGACIASNKYFAKFFGISERRVQQIIESLKKKGYVAQVKFNGRVRFLKCLLEVKKIPSQGRKEFRV
jgi:hypothetical protein